MSAKVAELPPRAGTTAPCAQTLTQINESLQARERLRARGGGSDTRWQLGDLGAHG